MSDLDRKAAIRALNDEFRKTAGAAVFGAGMLVTNGVAGLGGHFVQECLQIVREFDDFPAGDDPYGEHDFGSFEVRNQKLFWKIDYYDPLMLYGSEDPTDPNKTKRVLTIMLAEEY